MSTLLEKLNKGELVNAIGKSFNEYHEFIYKCVRNNAIIPDTILNDYLNEHIRIAKKESYPPAYMDHIVKIWYEYAYNLLEKNIEIPEIVLKAISRSSQQSANLIDLLLRKNKDVPDIILRPLPARDVGNRLINRNKKVPDFLLKTISKNPKDSYWFSIELMNHGKEIPDFLLTNLIKSKDPFDDALRSSLKNHLEQKGLKVPDTLKNALKKSPKLNESVIVNEKLDKDELTGVIANNPDASWELIDMCIKNQFVIPEIVLNNYFKDHPIFSEKEIPPIGLHILINKWHMYAHNLLIKNIDIPEIVLKAVSKQMGLASDLIAKFIKAKKDVPEILIKSISSSPKDSYWVARYLIERDKKVPEILNQSIAKEPMLLQTYKQFLREIEVEKKVKEAYASKEEVKESAIVNEKLDKEELLDRLAKESPIDAVEILLNLGKDIPENIIDMVTKGADDFYARLKSGTSYRLKDAFRWIIYDNIKKVSDNTINTIANNSDFDDQFIYDLAHSLLHYKNKIPDIILKRLSNNPNYSYSIAYALTHKEKEIPEILWPAISKLPPESPVSYPASLERMKNSYIFAERLRFKGIEIPVGLKIALDGFLKVLNNKNVKIPDDLRKEMENYKKINESSVINEKLDKEKLLQAAANDPFESFALAKKYVQKYKEPPEELVRGLTQRKKEEWTGSNYNHSVAYAMLAIDHDVKVPDYVLESILESEYDAYDYLIKMIKDKRIIPDDFLNVYFQKYYNAPEFLEQKPIFGQDQGFSKDVEIWYDYTEILLNKNVEIPENIIDAVSKSIYYSERLIDHLLYKKRDVPEILVKAVSFSPQYSYYSATHFIEYGKEVPEILNQVIAKNPIYQDMYDEFLSERKEKKKINESVVIGEKLDKEELVSAFLKDANVTYKYVQKNFLNKNQEPPEEFINAMAQSAYVSENYFKDIVKRKMNVPDVIKKGILKDSQSTLKTWQEFGEFMPMRDIVNSISQSHYKSMEFYKIQKEKNKKVPPIILKSIISNEYASYDLAKIFLEENKPVPDVIIRGFISMPQSIFTFAMEVLKKGFDLPKIILRTIADNYDNYMGLSGYADFDTILFSHLKQNKKIPDILLDAFDKKEDHDIARFCMKLGRHHIKIPDRILDTLIEKTPKHGVTRYLGAVSYDILSYYLIKSPESVANPEEVLKTIPTRLYQYAIGPDMAGIIHTKKIIKGFLTVFGKVPEDFKQAIIDEYKKYGNTIPKEIADTTGIKQSKAINEKLEKDELLDAVIKDKYQVNQMVFNFAANDKKIPEKLVEYISQNWNPSYMYQIAIDIIRYSNYDVPEMILRGIAKSNSLSNEMAGLYKNHYLEIPDVIMNALTPKQKEFYNSVWWSKQKPITEKLDKSELLNAVGSNLDKSDILDFAFNLLHLGNELPDNILKIVLDRPSWAIDHIKSIILKDKIIDTKRKDLHILLKSVSEDVYYSGELIKSLLRMGHSDIPDVLLKSIARNGPVTNNVVDVYILNRKKIPIILQKTYEAYIQQQLTSARNVAKKMLEETITEKLDKKELLKIISKDAEGSSIVFQHLWNDSNKRKNIPKEVLRGVSKDPIASYAYARSLSWKDVPLIIVKGIAKDSATSLRYAQDLVHRRIKIPNLIARSIYNNNLFAKRFDYFLFDIKQDKNVKRDKKDKEYFDNLFDGVINEKLDKGELLGVIQKDYDGYIQIMDFFFRKKNEYPPEEFLKMATETDEASRIFAEYCLEMKKDIPDEVIKKVAETPRSAYTIAALMILEERKVPEILIKSINSDPLSKKHFEQFAKNQKYPIHIPTLYYAKI